MYRSDEDLGNHSNESVSPTKFAPNQDRKGAYLSPASTPAKWRTLFIPWWPTLTAFAIILIVLRRMSLSTSTPRIKISVPREPSSSLSSSSSPTESRPLVRRPAEDTDNDEEEHEFDEVNDPLLARGGHGMDRMTPPKQRPQSMSTSATTNTAANSSLWEGLQNKNLNFPINTECK